VTRLEIEGVLGAHIRIADCGLDETPGCRGCIDLHISPGNSIGQCLYCILKVYDGEETGIVSDVSSWDVPSDELCDVVFSQVAIHLARSGKELSSLADGVIPIELVDEETGEVSIVNARHERTTYDAVIIDGEMVL